VEVHALVQGRLEEKYVQFVLQYPSQLENQKGITAFAIQAIHGASALEFSFTHLNVFVVSEQEDI